MELPNRKLPRLSGYDYTTPNCYFITICTHERKLLFWDHDKRNLYGDIAWKEIQLIPKRQEWVEVVNSVVMPNHVHLLLLVRNASSDTEKHAAISYVVGAYKAGVSRQIHKMTPMNPIWQRSFYDHIVRNESSFFQIWKYIDENEQKWLDDRFHPENE